MPRDDHILGISNLVRRARACVAGVPNTADLLTQYDKLVADSELAVYMQNTPDEVTAGGISTGRQLIEKALVEMVARCSIENSIHPSKEMTEMIKKTQDYIKSNVSPQKESFENEPMIIDETVYESSQLSSPDVEELDDDDIEIPEFEIITQDDIDEFDSYMLSSRMSNGSQNSV